MDLPDPDDLDDLNKMKWILNVPVENDENILETLQTKQKEKHLNRPDRFFGGWIPIRKRGGKR